MSTPTFQSQVSYSRPVAHPIPKHDGEERSAYRRYAVDDQSTRPPCSSALKGGIDTPTSDITHS